MNLIYSENLDLDNKVILFDGNFLGYLFHHQYLFSSLFTRFTFTTLIDPLIRFEFLRDIFLPDQYSSKQKFIEHDVFISAPTHHELFNSLEKNALIVSKIYKHKQLKNNPSIVDLFLTSRIIYMARQHPLLITGDSKDFSSCIFNTKGLITSVNEKDNSIQTYSVLEFSEKKFNTCYANLKKIL